MTQIELLARYPGSSPPHMIYVHQVRISLKCSAEGGFWKQQISTDTPCAPTSVRMNSITCLLKQAFKEIFKKAFNVRATIQSQLHRSLPKGLLSPPFVLALF